MYFELCNLHFVVFSVEEMYILTENVMYISHRTLFVFITVQNALMILDTNISAFLIINRCIFPKVMFQFDVPSQWIFIACCHLNSFPLHSDLMSGLIVSSLAPVMTGVSVSLPESRQFLLYARQIEIRGVDIYNPYYNYIISFTVPDIDNVTVVDYDALEKRIYWSDVRTQTIKRAFINGTGIETVVSAGTAFIHRLQVDYNTT